MDLVSLFGNKSFKGNVQSSSGAYQLGMSQGTDLQSGLSIAGTSPVPPAGAESPKM